MRKYIAVNVPRAWEKHLNEVLELPEIQKALEISHRDKKPSSLGVWIIEQFLIEKTSLRFEHFNTYQNHATLKDKREPNRLFDIYPRNQGELWCENCDSIDCEHVKFALTILEITEPLEKAGWERVE